MSGEADGNVSFPSAELFDFTGNVEGFFQVSLDPPGMVEAFCVLSGSGVRGGFSLSNFPILQDLKDHSFKPQ